MSGGWKFVADASVINFLLASKRNQRERALTAFRHLTVDPYVKPDETGRDLADRPINLLRIRGFEIAYWLDHYVKEVRIVEIRRA